MTVYTNDTLPTTTYTRDGSESLVSWDDLETSWGDINATWNGQGTPFQYDTLPTTSYTNDTL